MSTAFSAKQLPKTDISLTRSPNFKKYYISCSGRITNSTPTREPWLKILKLIKVDISDIDKSRILLGNLEKYGSIVVKVGDFASMMYEYENSKRVYSLKGFMKYICFFSCNDDFRTLPSTERSSICRGPGETMGVIIMPYFPQGSLAKYNWNSTLKIQFQACLKHALFSIIALLHKSNLIHGDFHPGNVLLKPTKQTSIIYNIPQLGAYNLKTYGLRPWIMDFENMKYANYSSRFLSTQSFNDFYYDIQKFFMLLYNTIKTLDPRTVSPIVGYISKKSIDGGILTNDNVDEILRLIDAIDFIPLHPSDPNPADDDE
jgi:serine/threonine protein kinase